MDIVKGSNVRHSFFLRQTNIRSWRCFNWQIQLVDFTKPKDFWNSQCSLSIFLQKMFLYCFESYFEMHFVLFCIYPLQYEALSIIISDLAYNLSYVLVFSEVSPSDHSFVLFYVLSVLIEYIALSIRLIKSLVLKLFIEMN